MYSFSDYFYFLVVVKTPTQPHSTFVGFNMKMTLHTNHHHPQKLNAIIISAVNAPIMTKPDESVSANHLMEETTATVTFIQATIV